MKAPVCAVADFICHCQSKFIAAENSLFDGRMSNRHGHVLGYGTRECQLDDFIDVVPVGGRN